MGSRILPSIHEKYKEEGFSFEKDESGYYKKITCQSTRDARTGKTEKASKEELDHLYELTSEESFDHEVFYEDIDGSTKSMRFKLVNK